jgi:ribose transport system ATP-binding protein
LSFVAGDRQTDGIFPLWSIARNMSQAALSGLQRHGLLDPAKESALVDDWRVRLGLRTDDVNLPVLSLSGGNQQKVLFARALSADAGMVLMDDPMRGVDVGTKQDVYQLIRSEAAAGRSFVWYSTEFEELYHCDRVYVFNSGRIVGEIARADLTEERVVHMSFEVAAA